MISPPALTVSDEAVIQFSVVLNLVGQAYPMCSDPSSISWAEDRV